MSGSNHRGLASLLILILQSPFASAQMLDYSALEQVFAEPVTTSVTGSPQRASEVPANMEIITAEEIRRSGARDLPGVLRHVIGVDSLQWGTDDADISVRGYDQAFSQRLLVLINGRQVYADYYGFTPWSTLPVEMNAIRQIEVVKGPASALFGFNAVAGVINIITYNPLYDDMNAVAVTGGTQSLLQGSAVTTLKPSENSAVRLAAGGGADADYATPIPAAMSGPPRQHNNRGSVDLDGVIQLPDHVQVRIEASHTKADLRDVGPTYNMEFSRFATDSVKGEVAADTRAGLLQATAYVNRIEQTSAVGVLGSGIDFKNQVAVARLQDVFKAGVDHTLRAAVEYRRDSTNTSPITGADIRYDVGSAAAMWDWRLSRTVSLTNAARVDRLSLSRSGVVPLGYPFDNSYWNRTREELSFNSGLVWHLGNSDTVRATSSRGVLLPNMVLLGALVAESPFVNLNGNPRLDPTVVTNQEIDWNRNVPALGVSLRAAAFSQSTTRIISFGGGFIPTAGTPYSVPANVGNSRARGVELGVRSASVGNWHWVLNYRFEEIQDRFDPLAEGGALFIDYEHTTPSHLFNANLGWAHGGWGIDGFARYQSATHGLLPNFNGSGTTLAPIAAYVAVDARIACKVSRSWTVALSGQNLLDSPQRQTSGPDVERQVSITATLDF